MKNPKELSMISHDLKNTINAMQLNLMILDKLIETSKPDSRDVQMKKQLDRLHHSVEKILHQIADGLDEKKESLTKPTDQHQSS